MGILFLKRTPTNDCYSEDFTMCVLVYTYTMELYTTTIITIDRFQHMNPTIQTGRSRTAKLFQRPYLYGTIFAGVCISLLEGIFLNQAQRVGRITNGVSWLSIGIIAIFAQATVAFLYTTGYRRVCRFVRNNPVHQDEKGRTTLPQYAKNLYKSVLYLMVLSLTTHVPMVVALMTISASLLTGTCTKTGPNMYTWFATTIFCMHLTVIVNPCIILYFNKKAKQWLRDKIFWHSRRPNNRG